MVPPSVPTSEENPMWYFTSPVPLLLWALPSNSRNKSAGLLPRIFTNTLRRPRWAMPMMASFVPTDPAR